MATIFKVVVGYHVEEPWGKGQGCHYVMLQGDKFYLDLERTLLPSEMSIPGVDSLLRQFQIHQRLDLTISEA